METIKRERILQNKTEKSVIDYIIVSRGLLEYLIEMQIDENKKHVLARYSKTKTGIKVVNSDHNILFCQFSVAFNRNNRKIRKEFFKFKSDEGRKSFLEETNSTNKFTGCFDNEANFHISSTKFYKTLKRSFHSCFKKVRIVQGEKRKVGNPSIQHKLQKKSKLTNFMKINKCAIAQKNAESKLIEIEEAIANELSSNNAEKVKEYVGSIETLDGNFSQIGLWKLKQKLCPQTTDPPMAKYDNTGNLITTTEGLKSLYLDTYRNRLKHREMNENYMDIYFLKSELWQSRLENLKRIKTKDWNMKQLENVLKGLKNNTSMDPNGMVNETFKEGYMGSDLKNALLIFFNSIKSNHIIPHYMTLGNITTIYKSKGSRLDLNNDRGIFILTVMKKILEKLIYNDIYKDIDQNMSDCNIGFRKKRNIRDHLLIIHGVIYSVIRGKEDLVDIQIYDIEKAFDTLWS